MHNCAVQLIGHSGLIFLLCRELEMCPPAVLPETERVYKSRVSYPRIVWLCSSLTEGMYKVVSSYRKYCQLEI